MHGECSLLKEWSQCVSGLHDAGVCGAVRFRDPNPIGRDAKVRTPRRLEHENEQRLCQRMSWEQHHHQPMGFGCDDIDLGDR